jgi:hypothetical protein
MKQFIGITCLIYLVLCGISFLLEAILVWLLCWLLKAIGVTIIFGWTVAFSWSLVLFLWIISWILSGLFRKY